MKLNLKQITLASLILLSSLSAFSDVVKSEDLENHCTLYELGTRDEAGVTQLKEGQTLVSKNNLYGFSLKDLEVDFESKVVKVNLIQNIVFGFNKSLFPEKVTITPENKDFSFLINNLNRVIHLFDRVCVTSENKLVYAKFFETQENAANKTSQLF